MLVYLEQQVLSQYQHTLRISGKCRSDFMYQIFNVLVIFLPVATSSNVRMWLLLSWLLLLLLAAVFSPTTRGFPLSTLVKELVPTINPSLTNILGFPSLPIPPPPSRRLGSLFDVAIFSKCDKLQPKILGLCFRHQKWHRCNHWRYLARTTGPVA